MTAYAAAFQIMAEIGHIIIERMVHSSRNFLFGKIELIVPFLALLKSGIKIYLNQENSKLFHVKPATEFNLYTDETKLYVQKKPFSYFFGSFMKLAMKDDIMVLITNSSFLVKLALTALVDKRICLFLIHQNKPKSCVIPKFL